MNLPDPVNQGAKWALVIGLAYFSADACCALIQRKLSVPPKPLPVAVVSNGVQTAPPQAVPPGLITLLRTTKPEGELVLAGAASASGRPNAATQPAAPPSNLQLRGTMAGDGGAGLAMIDVNGQTQVFGTGEEVAGFKVMEVTSYSVRLAANGQELILEMDSGGPVAAAPVPAMTTQANPDPNATPTTPPTPDPSGTPLADSGSIMTQRELRNILDNPAGFAGQGFRMKPVLNGGEIIGMRVAIAEATHPLARLGIQDGDVVKSLNGTPINGPEALSSLYRVLRNTSSLSFEVERGGVSQKVEVTLEE